MHDPFNQLPTDPEWVRKLDEIGAQARKALGCSIVLIAAQEDGKLALSIEPEEGTKFADLLEQTDVPSLLYFLARMLTMQEALNASRPQS